ncbi:uncharacterized protein HKW66_Vig0148210 [Vigna angularis]|uniref:Uncharacterized protein n=1 Tax=Phaseolus angularis TaxID=3914 RepID=A0A8T0JVI5_PHAAN|nr:uncharacterized protein HKW66_Vig0148210 [Vigna angularis]
MVVVDVGESKEEFCYGMVKEVVQKYGVSFNKQNRGDKEKIIPVVEEQTRVIADMQSSIHHLRMLVEAKNEDKGQEFGERAFYGSEDPCQSTSVQHQQQTPRFEREDEMKQSTMYDRMKVVPRRQFKSRANRTPFTTDGRRKE